MEVVEFGYAGDLCVPVFVSSASTKSNPPKPCNTAYTGNMAGISQLSLGFPDHLQVPWINLLKGRLVV
jgi:hypothetical protein